MNKMKYSTRDSEAGNYIDNFDTLEAARLAIAEYEASDREENLFSPHFYEIFDHTLNKIVE